MKLRYYKHVIGALVAASATVFSTAVSAFSVYVPALNEGLPLPLFNFDYSTDPYQPYRFSLGALFADGSTYFPGDGTGVPGSPFNPLYILYYGLGGIGAGQIMYNFTNNFAPPLFSIRVFRNSAAPIPDLVDLTLTIQHPFGEPNFVTHGVLVSPVPEVSSLALMIAGGLGLGSFMRSMRNKRIATT